MHLTPIETLKNIPNVQTRHVGGLNVNQYSLLLALCFAGTHFAPIQDSCESPSSPLKALEPSHPTASEVLEKYVDATGGEDQLKKIKSLVFQGDKEIVATRTKLTVVVIRSENGYMRNEEVLDQGAFVQGRMGTDCWAFRPPNEFRELKGKENADFVAATALHPQLLWLADASKVKFLGEELVEGKPVWCLDFRTMQGNSIQRYFDKETGLLLKEVAHESNGKVTKYFSDYRKLNGILIAHNESITRGDGNEIQEIIRYNQVLINVEGMESTFVPWPGMKQ